jgi:thiamine-phosphate pyrophosphorylase
VTHAAEVAKKPFFAIGGIGPLNAGEVVTAGAQRMCVVRAIRDAPHPEVAAEALRRAFDVEGSRRGVAPGG